MRVIQKFFIASLFMWAAPIAILYGFNHNLLPGMILQCLSFFIGLFINFFFKWLLVYVVICVLDNFTLLNLLVEGSM